MQQEVMDIFNLLKDEAVLLLTWGIVISFTATGVALFLKNIVENMVAYFLFMTNKRLGINVRVEIRQKKGTITDYNKRWIFIKTDDGGVIIVPIKGWQSEKWVLLDPESSCLENNGKLGG
jgi:hypothetical protein